MRYAITVILLAQLFPASERDEYEDMVIELMERLKVPFFIETRTKSTAQCDYSTMRKLIIMRIIR